MGMQYNYGMIMLAQGDIDSMDEWNDDKEMAYSIMDQWFDYVWDDTNGLRFLDRQWTDCMFDCEGLPSDEIRNEVIDREDDLLLERYDAGEVDMQFDSFDDVFRWILKKMEDGLVNGLTEEGRKEYEWVKERVKKTTEN